MHKAEPRLAISYEQGLYGKPRAPHPNPVGPLRRAQTTIHSLSDLKNLFQLSLHFCRHMSLQMADAGVLKLATDKTLQATTASVTTTIFI